MKTHATCQSRSRRQSLEVVELEIDEDDADEFEPDTDYDEYESIDD